MIFASDLDRTLIYSNKFLDADHKAVIVEYLDEAPLTYMTQNALKLLQEIRIKTTFIPTTTRTLEQYHRIDIFKGEDKPQYAIVSNGGNILINGRVDLFWQKNRLKLINEKGNSVENVMKKMNPVTNLEWVEKVKNADNVFFYLIVKKEMVDYKIIREWTDKLNAIDWELIDHGRRIYCIPTCINKGAALAYLANKLNVTKIVSSGDSRMDLSMGKVSDRFIVPPHGELVTKEWVVENENTSIALNKGMDASEDILKEVMHILSI